VIPIVPVYALPTVAAGGDVINSDDAAAFTTSGTVEVTDAEGVLESLAFTVRLVLLAVLGVPEIWQLLIVNPDGSVPLTRLHV
jgi:hypothetical protein